MLLSRTFELEGHQNRLIFFSQKHFENLRMQDKWTISWKHGLLSHIECFPTLCTMPCIIVEEFCRLCSWANQFPNFTSDSHLGFAGGYRDGGGGGGGSYGGGSYGGGSYGGGSYGRGKSMCTVGILFSVCLVKEEIYCFWVVCFYDPWVLNTVLWCALSLTAYC